MRYVYLLHSEAFAGQRYVGITSDLRKRLAEQHKSHYSRYPQHLAKVPDVSNVADATLEHLIAAFTPSINPR